MFKFRHIHQTFQPLHDQDYVDEKYVVGNPRDCLSKGCKTNKFKSKDKMYSVTSMYGFKNEKTLYADSSNIILRRNHCIWSGNLMAYPSNKPFKCFWSILFNISFGCSKDIIRFTKHILLPRYIPDFNLWIFVEWSDETLVNISSSIELW